MTSIWGKKRSLGRQLEMVVPYIVMLIFGGVFFVVPFLNFGQRKKHVYGHKKNC